MVATAPTFGLQMLGTVLKAVLLSPEYSLTIEVIFYIRQLSPVLSSFTPASSWMLDIFLEGHQ